MSLLSLHGPELNSIVQRLQCATKIFQAECLRLLVDFRNRVPPADARLFRNTHGHAANSLGLLKSSAAMEGVPHMPSSLKCDVHRDEREDETERCLNLREDIGLTVGHSVTNDGRVPA